MKLSEFWLLNRAKTLQKNVGEFRRILGVKSFAKVFPRFEVKTLLIILGEFRRVFGVKLRKNLHIFA